MDETDDPWVLWTTLPRPINQEMIKLISQRGQVAHLVEVYHVREMSPYGTETLPAALFSPVLPASPLFLSATIKYSRNANKIIQNF